MELLKLDRSHCDFTCLANEKLGFRLPAKCIFIIGGKGHSDMIVGRSLNFCSKPKMQSLARTCVQWNEMVLTTSPRRK